MTKTLISAMTAIGILATSSAAQAASSTVFISGSDLLGDNPSELGVSLPDAVSDSLIVNLTLPKGFKPNSTAKLSLRMASAAVSCNIALTADGAYRVRKGSQMAIIPGPTSGIALAGPGTVSTPAAPLQVFTKTVLIAPAVAGTVAGQKGGDTVLLVVSRQGGDAADTCASGVLVTSAKFTYQVQ